MDKYFGLSSDDLSDILRELISLFMNDPFVGTNGLADMIMDKYGVGKTNAYMIISMAKFMARNSGEIERVFKAVDDGLPQPLSYMDSDVRHRIDGPARIGILADVHVPFFDKDAFSCAIKELYRYDITHLILMGDFADFYAVSFWEKDPDRRNFKTELDVIKKTLNLLRDIFKDVEIIYLEGNHELRWRKYLIKKAPEVYGVRDFEIPSLLKLGSMNIKYIETGTRIEAGNLNIIHGHEYRSAASINIAISFLRKSFTNIMLGHFHTSQEYVHRKISGDIEGGWVVGCLCNLRPRYLPNNSWIHGFGFVDLKDDGNFVVINKKIYSGKVY